jgi:hypothetical protein
MFVIEGGAKQLESTGTGKSNVEVQFNLNFMPPGPAYNWICVVCSAADILSRAARIRASQLAPRSSPLIAKKREEGSWQKSPHDTKADTSVASRNTLEAAKVHSIDRTTDTSVEHSAFSREMQVPPSLAIASTGSTGAVPNSTWHEPISSSKILVETLKNSTLGGLHPDEVLFSNLVPVT